MTFRQSPTRHIHRDGYAELPRHPLILCASLVQHPANLGGLCRLAEIFRLESLVLSDLAIAESPAFRGLSSSAHVWQPLDQCSVPELPDWLTAQKTRGYPVVGLDADANATPIVDFCFPTQCVVLLGQELTGLPQEVLSQCDRTITIPQYGLVESLNVQHAGAIALYEYMRQHRMGDLGC